MDSETYTQLMRAIGRYGRLHIGDVEDIAISNAERAVFDLIEAYGDARAAQERERCARIADAYADPAARRRALRIAAEIGTDAGAGDAIGSSSTARVIAAAIRALD